MIQTKTLKEALKDPGVIEVVEELLPVGLSRNIGLRSSSCKLFEMNITNIGWSTENFFVKVALDEIPDPVFFNLSINYKKNEGVITWSYNTQVIATSSFLSNVLFFIKKEENKFSLYVQTTDARLYFIYFSRLCIGDPKEGYYGSSLSTITPVMKIQESIPEGTEQISIV